MVADPALIQEAKRTSGPATCSDGYLYTVTVNDASVYYDQCMSANLRPVTEEIIAVVSSATPL